MKPIYRGEDIEIAVEVTANANDAEHDYSSATFRAELTPTGTDPLLEAEPLVVDGITPDETTTGKAFVTIPLTDAETSQMSSATYRVKLWCVEGDNEQVVLDDLLTVI